MNELWALPFEMAERVLSDLASAKSTLKRWLKDSRSGRRVATSLSAVSPSSR